MTPAFAIAHRILRRPGAALLVLALVCSNSTWAQAAPQRRAGAPDRDAPNVHDILDRRSAALDSLLRPESVQLDTLGIEALADSFDTGGLARIQAHVPDTLAAARGSQLDFALKPFSLTTYNRVDGLRLGSGVGLGIGRRADATAIGAYGFARHRWAGRAALELELPRHGPLTLAWSDLVQPFGPNRGEHFTSLAALVAGQDRQDYLRRREFAVELPWRVRQARFTAGWFAREDYSVTSSTDFRFVGGGTSIQDANPSIDAGRTRGLRLSGRVAQSDTDGFDERERWDLEAEAGVAGGGLGGAFEYAWQDLELRTTHPVPLGSTLRLGVRAANTAGGPPVQALAYLGGDGNLRGYGRLEFVGRRSLALRVDVAIGRDLLAATRLPVLRRLGLQFIPHADIGTTWGDARGVATTRAALDGRWKSSAGIGVQRNILYPGIAAVRLDIDWRTDGAGGGPTYWFRVFDF